MATCGLGREGVWKQRKGRHAGREAKGRRKAAAVQAACRKAPTVEAEGRARVERTQNMRYMIMTLDVSQLSVWLNAKAHCRVAKEA